MNLNHAHLRIPTLRQYLTREEPYSNWAFKYSYHNKLIDPKLSLFFQMIHIRNLQKTNQKIEGLALSKVIIYKGIF
jgi:hypothetical protein